MKKIKIILTISLCTCMQACSGPHQELPKQQAAEKIPQVKNEITLSQAAQKRFGLKSEVVQSRKDLQELSTTGEIKADDSRVFHIDSLTTGRVVSDYAALGQSVKAGQILARIQNLEVVKIYGDFIHQSHQNKVDIELEETKLALAKKNYERVRTLFDDHIAPEKEMIKTASDLKISEQTVAGLKEHAGHLREEARVMLTAYGVTMPGPEKENIESTSPIISPKTGVITIKNITVGDVVSNTAPLYVVADLSKVWLDLAVYDKQLSSIHPGCSISFFSDSLPGKSFRGQVSYVKPATEENSGTFVARAVLDNIKLDLKPGMAGQVKIDNSSNKVWPFIPDNALQKYGNDSFVFIDLQNGQYKKRSVVPGERLTEGYLVKKGLSVGERIVTTGSFALKAEMLKDLMTEGE